jgi:hypothetical protein
MKWQTVAILCLVYVAVGAAAGVYWLAPALTQHHYTEKVIEREIPVIKEVVKTNTVTEIQYVPKEANPTTGEPEKTDVEAEIKQPAVNVKLNGQPYQFGLLQGEKKKFELGKVSLRQSSQVDINLEVKPQIIDRTKTGGIDLFVGRYSGITIQHKRIGIDVGVDRHGDQDYRLRWKAIQW